MRRNYISDEFKSNIVNGTLTMVEKSSFFGSKMMSIDDVILVDSSNIIYYQNNKSEQINLPLELTYEPLYVNLNNVKIKNCIVYRDDNTFNDLNNSNWIIEINFKNILLEYLFGKLKNVRTFNGIYVENTQNNNIDLSIKDYIISNLLDRYLYDSIELWISYNNLSDDGNLKYINIFNPDIANDSNINKEFEKIYSDEKIIKFKFKSKKDTSKYSFDYYFNIKYNRI